MASAGSGDPTAHPAWPSSIATMADKAVSSDLAHLPCFGSVPPKLIKRIVAKEYVDIRELLRESWQIQADGSCCHTKRPRRSMVTDISVWTECFATMAAVLASDFPEKASHFFTYLRTISRTFESSAWASYDMAFRRQAANRGSLDWGLVDPAFYNEAFAGRARRCRYCLANTHASQECLHAPAPCGAPRPTGWPSRSAAPAPANRKVLPTGRCRLRSVGYLIPRGA